VAGAEQPQHAVRAGFGKPVELGAGPHHGVAWEAGLPLGGQVAAVLALAGGAFDVYCASGQEMLPPAAHRHLEGKFGKLPGDVLARRIRRHTGVVFPMAVGDMGVERRRGAMGQAGGGDDAGGKPMHLGQFAQRHHRAGQRRGAVAAHRLRAYPDDALAGFHTAQHRGGGGGRIGDLGVDIVGLGQSEIRERLVGQNVLLARFPLPLAIGNTDRGVRGNAVAIGDKQNDIACPALDPPDGAARRQGCLTMLVIGIAGLNNLARA
jgi:hypothetical protein